MRYATCQQTSLCPSKKKKEEEEKARDIAYSETMLALETSDFWQLGAVRV